MAERRIYAVTDIKDGTIQAFITAGTKAQALAHHARNTHGVAVAKPEQLIAATKIGIEVVEAGAEPSE